MTTSEIKKLDTSDITVKYQIEGNKVFFDVKEWTWRAVNTFGFGVDSDLSLVKLLKRLIK